MTYFKKLSAGLIFAIFMFCFLFPFKSVSFADTKIPTISLDLKESDDPNDLVPALKIVGVLTILSIAPAILLMMTSFTRIVVVLSFVRQALGTSNMPPNQVIIGMSMFLTFFTMSPVIDKIKMNAFDPYIEKKISQEQAFELASKPIRKFMLEQTRQSDISLFSSLYRGTPMSVGKELPNSPNDIPLTVVIPSFIVSELKTAFQIGFIIYVPFLVIDMVVSSVLMAMGMVMLPPVVISLPFKMVLFVLIDGWSLITENVVKSFNI